MQMVVLLTGGVATREVLGPLEIVHETLGLDVVWAGRSRGPVPGHDPPMSFHADVALEDLTEPPTLLLLPGGFGSLELTFDDDFLAALYRLTEAPAVCLASSTGSLPLAASGRLAGLQVSGHWLSLPHLRRHGAKPVSRTVVKEGRFITTGGPAHSLEATRLAVDHILFGPGAEQHSARSA